MSDRHSDSPAGGSRWWPVWGLGLLLLYPLSIGPAAWMVVYFGWDTDGVPYRLLASFFVPLNVVTDATGTDQWLTDYVIWFIELAGGP